MPKSDLERFREKYVVEESGCWRWAAAINKDTGYGAFWFRGQMQGAHVAAYNLFVGEVPKGLELDHKCRNRWCCNPEHVEPVTRKVNCERSPLIGKSPGTLAAAGQRNRSKTHCPNGHPYDAQNTYHTGRGRQCRTCRLEKKRAARKAGAKW